MKNKSVFLVVAVFMVFLFSNNAFSFSLDLPDNPTYPIIYEIDFDNWEFQTDPYAIVDDQGSYSAPGGDGTTDNWGVFQVNDIADAITNATFWDSGDDGEYLIGLFYGIDYQSVNTTTTTSNLQSVGGTFDVYVLNEDQLNDFQASLIDGVDQYYDNDTIDYNEYHTITDISAPLFLSFDLVPGITPTDDNTIDGNLDIATAVFSGDATWYASITGGDYAYLFDTNGYSVSWTDGVGVQNGFADLYGVSDFGQATGGDFPTESQDPIEGTLVPEPSSIMLLGLGLLGFAGAIRRKTLM